jgi:hypothetical protein
MYCANEDHAEHTLFVCPRWHDERRKVTLDIQEELDPDNLVENMLKGEKCWNGMQRYMKEVDDMRAQRQRQLE